MSATPAQTIPTISARMFSRKALTCLSWETVTIGALTASILLASSPRMGVKDLVTGLVIRTYQRLSILTFSRALVLVENSLVTMTGQSRFPPLTLHSQSETSIFQLPGAPMFSSSTRCRMVLPVIMSLPVRTGELMSATTSVAVLYQSSSLFPKRTSSVIVILRSIRSTLTALLDLSHQVPSLTPLTLTLTLCLPRARVFPLLLSICPLLRWKFLQFATLLRLPRG